jgi:Ser/Thr protein kinase RdoA (MazF antagonist)
MTEVLGGQEALAKIIRDHYDLGTVERPEQLLDAHQRRHRKLVVKTSAGKFLVKTYKCDPRVLDALRFQHRLSDHLLGNGLPVAQIQRASNGKGIVEMGTWALELQRFVEGEPMQVGSETLGTSAAALGKFHHICRDFPRPPRDAQMWRFSEVPRAAFEKFFGLAIKCGDEARVVKCCNEIALFLREAAKQLSLEARDKFETGLIHGDWHGGNLLFKDNKLVAIVDLEFAGDGCFLEDMAYGISNLCVRTSNNVDRLDARTNLVLDHYQYYRTLSFYEQLALPYAVGVKHVTTVSYQIVQLGGKIAGYNPMQWMTRLADQCAWLAKRAHEVRWGKTE